MFAAHLGQQLIDDRVADTRPAVLRSSLFANSIQLIKDDNMQA